MTDELGKKLGRTHDRVGTRPIVPRQRAARRRDPDAHRPRRQGEAESAARPPPCRPQIHARQIRLSRRPHRAARRAMPAASELHPDMAKKLVTRVANPGPDYARSFPLAAHARNGGGDRPHARRQTRGAAAGARRIWAEFATRAFSPISRISTSSPARSRRRAGHAASTRASSPPTPRRSPTPSRAWSGQIPNWSNWSGFRSRRRPSSTCRPSPRGAGGARRPRRRRHGARSAGAVLFHAGREVLPGTAVNAAKRGFLDICQSAARLPANMK